MARLFTNRELLELFRAPCRKRTDNGREPIVVCEDCATPSTADLAGQSAFRTVQRDGRAVLVCRTCAETASLSPGTRIFPSRSGGPGRSD